MENLSLIATVGFIHLLALISPGPDFVVACSNSIQYSKKTGLWTAVGFGIGVSVHICFAFFGLSWLVSQSGYAFNIVKYMGAGYLIYLGINSIISNKMFSTVSERQNKKSIKWFEAVANGLLTNILNPKATLFFISLFTLVVGPGVDYMVMIFLTFVLISSTILWFSLVAIFLSQNKIRELFERFQLKLNLFFGIILALAGIGVVWF
ncbi:MAG: amino acid transporter [Flavobacteriaceae bacterium]|nr:amino acid transporter [Flavobacteriaceae bacterium]